jgi:hypothetical protein
VRAQRRRRTAPPANGKKGKIIMNRTARAARTRKTLWSIGLASALLTMAPAALAQQRVCNISGSLTINVPTTGAVSEPNFTATYTENGSFVTGSGAPSTTNLQLGLPSALSFTPAWLLAPFFQTMGANEGPDTCAQVGDQGTITYLSSPCGNLTDTFSVTSTSPYTLSHVLSGTIDVTSLFNVVPATSEIIRNVQTEFTTNGASGEVVFTDSAAHRFCNWGYTVVYTACHPRSGVVLPVTYQATAIWNAGDSNTQVFTGTIARDPINRVPGLPPAGVASLLALLAAGGVLMYRWRFQRG